MMRRQEALGEIIAKDPAVATYAMAIGAGGSTATLNNGRFFITLKPQERARRLGGRGHRPAAAAAREGRGRAALPAGGAGRQRRRPASRARSSSTRCRTPTSTSSTSGRRRCSRSSSRCRCCATWRPTSRSSGTTLTLDHRPRPGRALRAHAAADRRHALRRLRPAPGGAVLHPAEQLPRRHGDPARAAGRGRQPRQDLHQARRPPGSRCRSRPSPSGPRARPSRCRSATRASSRPSPSASTWRQGASLGTATEAIQQAEREMQHAAVADRHLPGQRPGVPGLAAHRADADRGGAVRRLPDPRHPLRELHPPAHHPVDAALGRRRRDRDADAVRLRFQPGRHDRRHPADRHRQEERHHDGRLRHHAPSATSTCRPTRRSARRRCCASARS